MFQFQLWNSAVVFECLRLLLARRVKPGRQRPCQIGKQPLERMHNSRLRWAQWRRLLLRLFSCISLQGWQTMMEVVRTPQLRCARQLQARRERLEKEAHKLMQEEQSVMAQA